MSGAFVHLFNAEVVSSTYQAVKRYFSQKGGFVELGEATKQELINHKLVQRQILALKNGTAKVLNGNLSVDLTLHTFHVGDTGVVFNTVCLDNTCTTGFVGFVQAANGGSVATSPDTFSNPFGIGIEISPPYYYIPISWSITYPNNFRH